MSSEKVKSIENHDNPPQTGHTALQRAAAGGHLDIARLLVTQGASLDHQDELVSVVMMVLMVVKVVVVMIMMTIAKILVIKGTSLDHQDELVRLRRADVGGDGDGDGGEELKLVALHVKQQESSLQVCFKTAVFSLIHCMVIMR